jgi:hypothetical protein
VREPGARDTRLDFKRMSVVGSGWGDAAMSTSAKEYYRPLAGRLWIGLERVEGSAETASRLEQQMADLEGVIRVAADPVTGNVLILYDVREVRQLELLGALKSMGYLG